MKRLSHHDAEDLMYSREEDIYFSFSSKGIEDVWSGLRRDKPKKHYLWRHDDSNEELEIIISYLQMRLNSDVRKTIKDMIEQSEKSRRKTDYCFEIFICRDGIDWADEETWRDFIERDEALYCD